MSKTDRKDAERWRKGREPLRIMANLLRPHWLEEFTIESLEAHIDAMSLKTKTRKETKRG